MQGIQVDSFFSLDVHPLIIFIHYCQHMLYCLYAKVKINFQPKPAHLLGVLCMI